MPRRLPNIIRINDIRDAMCTERSLFARHLTFRVLSHLIFKVCKYYHSRFADKDTGVKGAPGLRQNHGNERTEFGFQNPTS